MTRTISKLAKELGVNVETIRFYERRGLISQPEKPETGYRHYSDDVRSRIRFIKRAQGLGFTLEEIANLGGCLRIENLLRKSPFWPYFLIIFVK